MKAATVTTLMGMQVDVVLVVVGVCGSPQHFAHAH